MKVTYYKNGKFRQFNVHDLRAQIAKQMDAIGEKIDNIADYIERQGGFDGLTVGEQEVVCMICEALRGWAERAEQWHQKLDAALKERELAER